MPPMSLREYLAIGKLLALLGAIALICFQSHEIHKWHLNSEQCASARHADRTAYAQAQATAQAENAAQIARVKTEQERITGNVEQTYEADLAHLRAELGRLLAQPKAAPGAPGHSAAPDLPNAAGVADDSSRVSIPSGLYVRGAELELQLERLQQWVKEQVAVDPNK